MEVHHSHSSSHRNGHKKKWHEYFLEFLMLFLAVFLGFMAENIREHKIEHTRAKEFSKSLVRDLQNDITAIEDQIHWAGTYVSITDSLLYLNKKKLEGHSADEFSFYTRFMYWTAPINWHRATFEQIKNSGGLRYFRNYRLLEKLMRYDALINENEGEFINHQTRGNMLLNLINKIIEPGYHQVLSNYFLMTLDTISTATREQLFSDDAGSLENKREEIMEMLNMVVVQQRNLRLGNESRLPMAIALAKELIVDLKTEYHLE
jgi:uncharacterized protein YejL (UPF0352 family)